MDINAPLNPNLVLARCFPYFHLDVFSSEICFFHEMTESAYIFLCDSLSREVFQSEFVMLSTESVDN